jgi:hypothetical protein
MNLPLQGIKIRLRQSGEVSFKRVIMLSGYLKKEKEQKPTTSTE